MKVHGWVTDKGMRDVGKGKNAESVKVGLVTIKLDALDGLSGRVQVPVPADKLESDYSIGDVATVTVDFNQTKLNLTKRAAGS